MIHQVSCFLLPYFYCEISKISVCWFSCHSASWPPGGAQLRPCLLHHLLHQIHSWFSSSLSSPLSSFPFFLFFILLYFVFSSFSGSVSFHLPHSFCPSHSTSSFFLSSSVPFLSSSSFPFSSSSSLPSFPAATHFVIFRFVLLFSFLFITCAAADASHYSHTVVWNISGLSPSSSSSCLLRLLLLVFFVFSSSSSSRGASCRPAASRCFLINPKLIDLLCFVITANISAESSHHTLWSVQMWCWHACRQHKTLIIDWFIDWLSANCCVKRF